MITRFQTEAEFVADVRRRLQVKNVPETIAAALADGIATADRTVRAEASGVNPTVQNLRIGTWFIRDDDLPLFDAIASIGGVVATVASGGVLAPAAGLQAAVSFAKACWQVWRRGARLSAEQLSVLRLLSLRGPLAPGDVRHALADESTASGVERLLHSLETVELHDGALVALVRCEADGRWKALPA
jgi:hypothetical protein